MGLMVQYWSEVCGVAGEVYLWEAQHERLVRLRVARAIPVTCQAGIKGDPNAVRKVL